MPESLTIQGDRLDLSQVDPDDLIPPDYIPGPKGINIEDIIELRAKGLSQSQIAKILGCDHSNISQRLSRLNGTLEHTHKFKKNRALILAFHQTRISQSITDADIRKAKLIDKVKAMSFLHNQERLEDGLSTANIAYADMVKQRQATKSEMQEIEAKYGRPETTSSSAS